jgi:hypothetical protein
VILTITVRHLRKLGGNARHKGLLLVGHPGQDGLS